MRAKHEGVRGGVTFKCPFGCCRRENTYIQRADMYRHVLQRHRGLAPDGTPFILDHCKLMRPDNVQISPLNVSTCRKFQAIAFLKCALLFQVKCINVK